jgi:hypothetical protein
MVDGVTASNGVTIGGSLPNGMDISGNPCIVSSACDDDPQPSQYGARYEQRKEQL